MYDKEFVSGAVKKFYAAFPFPGYMLAKYNLKDDLKKYATEYARMLYMNMPYGKTVLDIGCGTGQLSCLLSLKASRVVGVDFSEASIKKADELKQRLKLKNVEFLVRTIETLDLQEKFDYVFCNGVLHHLRDPYKGFTTVCETLAEGSFCIIGFYNTFGRVAFKLTRFLSHKKKPAREITLAENAIMSQRPDSDNDKELMWNKDQYCHPYETSFTVSEVLGWFSKNNIGYVSSMPSIEHFESNRLFTRPFARARRLVKPTIKNSLVEWSWTWNLRKSGGYAVIIGGR